MPAESKVNNYLAGFQDSSHISSKKYAELQQAIVRVAFTVLIGGYTFSIYFLDLFGGISIQAVVCISIYAFAALLIVLWNLILPAKNPLRRIISITVDIVSATYMMIAGGVLTACIYGGYLWVSIANGLRFGKFYMKVAYIQSIIGFSLVLIFSDFWRDNLVLGIGLMVWILLLPLYVYKLLVILESAIDEVVNANKSKSQFFANMSHEMRTPLTAIIGFAEEGIEQGGKHNGKILQIIKQSGDHLLRLINELLDFSKAEANELEIKKEQCSPFEIIENIKEILQQSAHNKNLLFEIDYHFPLPSKIITDPLRLKQILINLCGNAIKFTESGFVRLGVSYDTDKDTIEFSVIDSGIGIPDSEIMTVFEPFKQVDSSLARRYSGTGLGLAISDKLSQLLNGTLNVKSQSGEGTEFTLTLSCQHIGDNLVDKIPDAQNLSENFANSDLPPRLSGNVLIAEDNEINQRLLMIMLGKLGVSLSVVGDGESAIDAALSSNFDLILMDIQMPKLSGIEVVKKLRSKQYTKPIIALTANAMADNQKICSEVGFDYFLTKPIIKSKLYEVCARYLDTTPILSEIIDQEPEMIDLVATFVAKLPAMLDNLRYMADAKEWSELSAKIHDLKGLGGGFGYPEISQLAQEMELCLNNRTYYRLDKQLSELGDMIVRVSTGLKEYQNKNNLNLM